MTVARARGSGMAGFRARNRPAGARMGIPVGVALESWSWMGEPTKRLQAPLAEPLPAYAMRNGGVSAAAPAGGRVSLWARLVSHLAPEPMASTVRSVRSRDRPSRIRTLQPRARTIL